MESMSPTNPLSPTKNRSLSNHELRSTIGGTTSLSPQPIDSPTFNSEATQEFQKKLKTFNQNVLRFHNQGYKLLSLKVCLKHPNLDLDQVVAVEEYSNLKEINIGERSGVRLFEKGGQLFLAKYNDMLKDENCAIKLAADREYIWVTVVKNVLLPELTTPMRMLETRVLPGVKSGHPTLLRKDMISESTRSPREALIDSDKKEEKKEVDVRYLEGASLVAAGAFYVTQGQVLLLNNQTGNFYGELFSRGFDNDAQEIVADYVFSSVYYDFQQANAAADKTKKVFFPYKTTADESHINADAMLQEELKTRGFGASKLGVFAKVDSPKASSKEDTLIITDTSSCKV